MIPERGVSYYGVAYPDRAALDFQEMIDHGCNAVLLAVSEFDWWFWRKNTAETINVAQKMGLRTYVDLWGWGKTLAGEPPSLLLMRDLMNRQVSASGLTYHAMCLNRVKFRDFLKVTIKEMIKDTSLDGFFWDEPHYANWHESDWACRCPHCQELYMKDTGTEMPKELTTRVIDFRERNAIEFLTELSQTVKKEDKDVDVICCLLPTQSPLIGITDWEKVASIKALDVLATDPYWYHLDMGRDEGLAYFREVGEKCLQLAQRHGKKSQLWLQAFRVPEGREDELKDATRIASELGADSLFAWPYRGGLGSILESGDARKLWGIIGEAYREATND